MLQPCFAACPNIYKHFLYINVFQYREAQSTWWVFEYLSVHEWQPGVRWDMWGRYVNRFSVVANHNNETLVFCPEVRHPFMMSSKFLVSVHWYKYLRYYATQAFSEAVGEVRESLWSSRDSTRGPCSSLTSHRSSSWVKSFSCLVPHIE